MLSNRSLASFLITPLLAFALTPLASAQLFQLSAPSIDGHQETPPVASPGFGSGCFTLDLTAHRFHYDVTIGGLVNMETSATIRSGAVGVMGPVLVVMPLGSPKWGTVLSTPALETALLAGAAYVEIEAQFSPFAPPIRELRGQILTTPCVPLPAGMEFCSNGTLGVDHTTPCPCGNIGAPANGCASSVNPLGAHLGATGAPVTNDVVLHGSGMPGTAFGLYMQHAASGDVVFHDGVLCAGGALIRLRGVPSVGGASSFPDPLSLSSTITLSARGGVLPGSGARRYYGVWYRNPAATFCPPSTANVTNGYLIDW